MSERDYEQELANIYNALAESVWDMSDEEIEEEIRADGEDPDTVAESVRQVLRDAVRPPLVAREDLKGGLAVYANPRGSCWGSQWDASEVALVGNAVRDFKEGERVTVDADLRVNNYRHME